MFKKQVLVLAMLAISGAAFADNEAEISQDGKATASLATIVQDTLGDNAVTGQLTGNYGQIIQSGTAQSSAQLYQGNDPANDTAVLDVSAGAPTSQSILSAVAVTLPVDPLAYVSVSAASSTNSAAVIAQFASVNTQASILQLTGGEDLSVGGTSTIVYMAGVANSNGNAASGDINSGSTALAIAAAPNTAVTYSAGANTYQDSFMSAALTVGAGVGGGVNNGNLAVINQGSTPADRAGNDLSGLGGGTAWTAGTASYDSESQIIQSGVGNTAVALQAGDAQMSSIYQDGLNNDAYIVQFGQEGVAAGANDTTADPLSNFAAIVQLATADVATIYQGGTSNTAYILQH